MKNARIQRTTHGALMDHLLTMGAMLEGRTESHTSKVLDRVVWTVGGVVVAMSVRVRGVVQYFIEPVQTEALPAGYSVVPLVFETDKYTFICADGNQWGVSHTYQAAAAAAREHSAGLRL